MTSHVTSDSGAGGDWVLSDYEWENLRRVAWNLADTWGCRPEQCFRSAHLITLATTAFLTPMIRLAEGQ